MPREEVARKLEQEPFFEPGQPGTLYEGAQVATPRTLRIAERIFSGLVGTGVGAVQGLATGGPLGAAVGATAGAAGELVQQEVERRTGSVLKGAGAGTAVDVGTDLLLSALLRRPSISTRRAGKALEGAGLLGKVGPEGASEVAEAVTRQYDELIRVERAAWDQARAALPDTRVSSAPIKKAMREALERTRGVPGNEKSQTALMLMGKDEFGKPLIGDSIGIDDAQTILSRLNDDLAVAAGPDRRFARRSVGVSGIRDAVNRSLDEIEQASPEGAAGVTALRTARKATANRYALVPAKSTLHSALVGERAFDQPEKAFQAILRSRQPVKEVQRIKALTAGDKAAERGLKRVAIQHIFGRAAGGTGEIAPRSAGAAASAAEATDKALREILGDRGFETIQKLNRQLYKSTRPNRLLPEVATQGTGTLVKQGTGATLGAVAAIALGSSATTGAVAGATAGTVLAGIGKLFGPNVARQTALEALTDPAIMKQVVAQAPSGRAVVEQVVESLIRRGILTFEDFAPTVTHDEPQGTASTREAPDARSAPRGAP